MYSNYNILNINVRPISEADRNAFPTMAKPDPIGCYSVSPAGHFEHNNKRLRFFVEPLPSSFPLSLKAPLCESLVPGLNSNVDYLDNLLYFVESQKHLFLKRSGNIAKVNADIVCTREVLQLMMSAPYEVRHNWSIGVTKFRNTIYISRVDNVLPSHAYYNEANLNMLMHSTWIKKLRQYCLLENPVIPNNVCGADENGQFNCVFGTEICGMRVLFDAPMVAEYNPNRCVGVPEKFTSLKIRMARMNRSEWTAHNRNEAVKWWAECFLVGIESVFIGLCDEDANVHKIIKTTARTIWKEGENDWSTCVCANFMVRLLSTIKRVMAQVDCPSTVYMYEFDASIGRITYRIYEGRNQNTFIPDWFRIMLDEYSTEMLNT